MPAIFSSGCWVRLGFRTLILVLLIIVAWGCGPREPKLSKKALAFKKGIQASWKELVPKMGKPVAKRDVPAINGVLKDVYAKAEQGGHPLPFRFKVLDYNGISLTDYPEAKIKAKRFGAYKSVRAVLKNQKIATEKLFLPGGEKIFVILFPLIYQGKLVGVLAAGFDAEKIKQKWEVSEEEFFAIDFNK